MACVHTGPNLTEDGFRARQRSSLRAPIFFTMFCQARDPALTGGDTRLTETGLWLVVTAAAHSGGRGLCLGQMARGGRATHTTQLARHTPITAARGRYWVVTTSSVLERRLMNMGVDRDERDMWDSNPN